MYKKKKEKDEIVMKEIKSNFPQQSQDQKRIKMK